MITDKIIERCQKIIDKENKPKTEAEKDTLRGKTLSICRLYRRRHLSSSQLFELQVLPIRLCFKS